MLGIQISANLEDVILWTTKAQDGAPTSLTETLS